MGKYISCGQYNKYYKYIILGIFFNILVNFIFGFDLNDDFKQLLLFPSDGQKKLYKHVTVHEIFQYIGIFIFSCIIERISNKNEIISQGVLSLLTERSDSKAILIFKDSQDEIGRISILNFIFVITVNVCLVFSAEIFYQLGLKIFDFWMFELLVMSYINAKMFNLKIYKHQIFAIIFNSFICLLFRLPSFILSFSLEDEKGEKDPKSLYKINGWYIVLGLIIYIIIITFRAYTYIKIKWFMDLKFISSAKLVIYISFIGILISSISCIIQTNIKCSPKINFCEISYTNSSSKYLDNFEVYYEKISNLENNEIIIETCVIFFGMICKFFAFYYDILIVQYLTPIHNIFYCSIYYSFIKIIALFYNKIKTNHFFNGNEENNKEKFYIFFLDLSGNIIAIFGFLIYLEIIEFEFCNFNYNSRKSIIKRSIDDVEQSIVNDDFNEKVLELGANPL